MRRERSHGLLRREPPYRAWRTVLSIWDPNSPSFEVKRHLSTLPLKVPHPQACWMAIYDVRECRTRQHHPWIPSDNFAVHFPGAYWKVTSTLQTLSRSAHESLCERKQQ